MTQRGGKRHEVLDGRLHQLVRTTLPTKGFLRFLKRNVTDKGPVGDLAKDMLADPYLPRDEALSFFQFKRHLETVHHVEDKVLETLEMAWELWEREKLQAKLLRASRKR